MLARAGIGRFRLLDRDRYEPSNLNRQVFATAQSVGRPKVEVAAERLREINPYIVVEKSFFESVSIRNAEEMLDGADLVMVCTDSPSSHIFFQQVARRRKIRLIMGAAPTHGAGVWVVPHERPGSGKGPVSRLRSLIRRLRGGRDIYDLSEEEALALDKRVLPSGGFTPTISYVPNCAACLASALAISGMDTRPHALHFDFERFRALGPIAKAFHSLRQSMTA
jgi:hypothetical protein